MLNLFLNVVGVILLTFHVDYCTLTREDLQTVDEWVAGDRQEEHTNSTHHFEFQSSHDSNSEKSSVSTRRSKRDTQFLVKCSQVQPKLVDGYYYKFDIPSSRSFANHIDIISAGYAYLSAIETNVLKRPHRYFDINDFLAKSGIVFPPTLPLVCYDTGYILQESALFHYGKEDLLRDLNSAEGTTRSQPPSGSSNTRLSATRHINPNSGYMIQRRKMYGELGNLVQNLQQGQNEALKRECSDTMYRKTTDLIIELLGNNTIQAMSPKYSLEQFNEVAKLFIGDIVAYEMIRQACKAAGNVITEHVDIFPQVTADDWKPIADKLQEASYTIRNRAKLQTDSLKPDLDRNESNYKNDGPLNIHSSLESVSEDRHADALMGYYFQFGFRVSSHAGWASNNTLAREMCKARQNQICIKKRRKLFMVKWKPLRPSELSATYQATQQYIKFPMVTPPPPSHNFAALYTKVETALKKVQNAVNYFRANELQQQLLCKNVSNLIHAIENSAGYDIYEETAEHFAKTLDVLYVFKKEVQPLINTLSEVAMHVGEEGIDKVWLLIDRSFLEMDFYMSDIQEHIMQMRLRFKEKYAPLLSSSVEDTYVKEFLFGNRMLEEIKNVQHAFKKYQRWARFYAKEGNIHGTRVILKEFIDKCCNVTSAIDTLPTGYKTVQLEPGLRILGAKGPFYIQTFFLVPLYDITYLTMYAMFCACQRYRWLAERNLVSSDRRMSTSDIHQFMYSTRLVVSDVSKKLDEFVEVISIYAYKGKFYWIDRLWSEIASEALPVKADVAYAERVANKLKVLFPWNNFTVDIIQPLAPDRVIPQRGEKIYYYKFLFNPDYSMVRMDSDTNSTFIVNWVPDKIGNETGLSGENFGFNSGSDLLCNMATRRIISDLSNYQNIKSLFVWRTNVGRGWHLSDMHDDTHDRNYIRLYEKLSSRTYGGDCFGVKRSDRTCWYRYNTSIDNVCLEWHGLVPCHFDDQLAIYALANFGDDY